ncbi:calcineurin-like phosphoesterase-like protein [Fragilaria crotonensis]|nr:calcineurin-like phosphoesterase-like protein [Fragilaria crotonensis]
MLHACLQLLLLSSLVASFAVDRRHVQISPRHGRQTSLCSADGGGYLDGTRGDDFTAPLILILDAASITASSNYPWTVESLAASAPLIRNQDELVLILVESQANLLYSGGPLAQGVGLWFANSEEQLQLTDEKFHYISNNPSFSTLSTATFLSDVESLGPCTGLEFRGENSVNVQAYMDLQAEIQELRDILKPQKRRGISPNARKGVSRKQRTKAQKRTTKLETKLVVGKQRKGYNVTTDAAILRQRLGECGTCTNSTIVSGLAQIKSILQDREVGDETKVTGLKMIHGAALSEQVLTITRRSNISTALRMVVLSDTHGFESHFRKYGNGTSGSFVKLPDADVLIHCGDFYGPGRSLDAFLAAQSHIPAHIVVRGNHDPLQYSFSNAQYITKRQTVTLQDGTILEARPFLRSRNPQAVLPEHCDVLMTHEPPFGICDQTYRMERVGSLSLRHAVESSPMPPALWLCGHIHEGRGAVWHSFLLLPRRQL